jgi:hypothetical protein
VSRDAFRARAVEVAGPKSLEGRAMDGGDL